MITGSHFFEAIVELTIWIADAHRDDGKRFVVRADEKLTAFLELEAAIRGSAFALTSWRRFVILATDTKA